MALKGRGGRRSSSKADKTGPDPGAGGGADAGGAGGGFGMGVGPNSAGANPSGVGDTGLGGKGPSEGTSKDVSFKEALAEKFKPVSDFLSGIKKTQAYQDIAEAADTVKDFGLSTSPTLSGVLTAANLANFAGTKLDEEGNIKTGFFGKPGVSTYGDLDLGNYSFDQRAPFGNVTDEIGTLKDLADMQQGFLGAGMQFDSEGNFTGTDFDSLKDYADAMGMTYQGEDLEALASEVGGSVGQGNDRVPVIPDPEDPYEGDEEASAMYQQYLEDGYPEDLARYLVDELGVFGLD